MQSSRVKKIAVEIHLEPYLKKTVMVAPTDKLQSLEVVNSYMDFYLHGEKLDLAKTFVQLGIGNKTILHTSDKARPVFQFDPVYFRFLNGTVIQLSIPKVWTFKRTVQAVGASNGIDPERISLVFEGRKLNPLESFMDEKTMANFSTIMVVVTGDLPSVS